MSKEKRLVPELRFPEFDGEWEETTVDEVFDYLKTNSLSRSQLSNIGNIRNIHYGDIHTKFQILLDPNEEEIPYVNNELSSINVGSLLKNGDLILADASEDSIGVGKSIELINVHDSVVSGLHTIAIRPKIELFYRGYIGYYFNSYHNHRRLVKMSVGSKVKSISKATLSKTSIFYPIIKEQQKIATFLSLIDKKIELLEKKIELLEEQKRGLLQKIFSQELRFKKDDGSEFEEWEIKKLIDCLDVCKSGGTPRSTNRSYYNGEYPFLSISDMTKQGKYLSKTEKSVTQKGIDNSSTWLVQPNHIIYSMYASVGEVSINHISLCTSQAMLSMLPNKNVNLEYLYYYLKKIKEETSKFIGFGAQGNVSAQIVKNYDIFIPELEEQKKIANFLSKHDWLIDNAKRSLDNISKLKKGLLQKMFI